ncbi:MAG: DNA ligase D [Phycisphaerales bacterium]|jgi:bifunctional non-homologous end joining protein LigD
MALDKYRKKRDFALTPEPKGGRDSGGSELAYVVQKHDASHLHFDFRLQIGGALASWAVPKGPSLDPADKRLAVHVEDHPIDYAQFEGTIPKGQYGGGTVMIWDRGTWVSQSKDAAAAVRKGKLDFTLFGERLKGAWTLTRLKSDSGATSSHENWLLIKRRDEFAREGGQAALKDTDPSVTSGRSLREIASDLQSRTWDSSQPDSTPTSFPPLAKKRLKPRGTPPAAELGKLEGARRAPLPTWLPPELCTLTDHAPTSDDWLHEIKFDGYRLLARKDGDQVTLLTRSGKDWTHKFAPLALAIAKLGTKTALIDGEATIVTPDGRTSFQGLQNAIKVQQFRSLAFFAFDLLYLNGDDLTRVPLLRRKEALRACLPSTDGGLLRYSDHVVGGGAAVEHEACSLSLEGIVCKRADSPYTSGRGSAWLKVKCIRRQEFVIIGWTPPSGSRKHFGSLLLGIHDDGGRLLYAGKVGTGFDARTLKDIKAQLDKLARKSSPTDAEIPASERAGARWVDPSLVAEVSFTEWTADGRLRHPAFEGLRADKPAGEVRMESAAPIAAIEMTAKHHTSETTKRVKQRSGPSTRNAKPDAAPAGVHITHPERVLYPDSGITKLDVARYYEQVAEHLLPFVASRPLSAVRCPSGIAGQCFFQKHVGETFAEPVHSMRVKEGSGYADYITVDSAAGLLTLIQFGVLELHPWGSTKEHLEFPDTLTLDLDPGEGTPFSAVKEAALRVRERLESLKLAAFLKPSGGKGLHVVVPLEPDVPWDEAKAFCAALAAHLVAQEPIKYIATASKALRRGKVFIDHLRNSRGATSVAPYSTRARPGAPVAVPLAWSELSRLKSASQFNIDSVLRRLATSKSDPWKDFESSRRSLRRALQKSQASPNRSASAKNGKKASKAKSQKALATRPASSAATK